MNSFDTVAAAENIKELLSDQQKHSAELIKERDKLRAAMDRYLERIETIEKFIRSQKETDNRNIDTNSRKDMDEPGMKSKQEQQDGITRQVQNHAETLSKNVKDIANNNTNAQIIEKDINHEVEEEKNESTSCRRKPVKWKIC